MAKVNTVTRDTKTIIRHYMGKVDSYSRCAKLNGNALEDTGHLSLKSFTHRPLSHKTKERDHGFESHLYGL